MFPCWAPCPRSGEPGEKARADCPTTTRVRLEAVCGKSALLRGIVDRRLGTRQHQTDGVLPATEGATLVPGVMRTCYARLRSAVLHSSRHRNRFTLERRASNERGSLYHWPSPSPENVTRMLDHSSLHEALRVEEVRRHGAAALEYVIVRLQKSKSDIRYTLHARPTFYTLSGGITQADLLHRLGFSHGPCAFLTGDQCIAREVPEDFDLPRFTNVVERAFTELEAGIKLMFECGFYVEHRLFGKRLPPVVEALLSNRRGDGHNAPKRQSMKQSQDASFDYRFTWIEGGSDKGWTFHYRPKHLPPSAEIASLLAFLGLAQFPECPEFDFEQCYWRFCSFVDTGDAFHGPAEIAHGWFDSHAQKFSSGLQRLLDAHATLATFGFELLPRVRANVPPEVVQPPRPRRAPVRRAPPGAPTPSAFDVAISFAGPQRSIAEAIAMRVRDAGFEVFYDAFYPEQLWGKDLAVFFDDVFRKKSRYCVIIVSKDYVERDWTNQERQSAVARAIRERGKEYILPVKVDDGVDLPGVADTIGYVSLGQYPVEKIAELLIAKLGS